MVNYICQICNKNFSRKSDYIYHTENKKKPCKPKQNIILNNNPIRPDKLTCKYCDYKFSTSSHLSRHIKENRCKIKKELDDEKEKNFKLLLAQKDNEIKELKSMIKEQNEEFKKHLNKINNKSLTDKTDIAKINKSIKKLKEFIPTTSTNIVNNQLMNIIIDKNKKIDELVNNKEEDKNIVSDVVKQKDIVNNQISDLIINEQVIMCRETDKYINATQLCKAGGKKFNDWFRLESTKELITELGKSNMCPETGNPASVTDIQNIFIEKNIGGNNKNNQNTWIHPDLAIQLAQWISPKFALLVSSWIRTLLTNGKVEINSKLFEQEKIIKESNTKIKLLQDMVIKKQKRNHYPDKNVIYLITTNDNKNKRIYIVGKAINLKDRLSVYNKTCEHEVVYYKSCETTEQMELVEKMVLNKLEEYREKANRDRFILPINNNIKLFINIIDKCVDFFNNIDNKNSKQIINYNIDEVINNINEQKSINDKEFEIQINKEDLNLKKKRGRPKKNNV
jgi:hypothetical protein